MPITPQKQAEIDLLRQLIDFHFKWITFFTGVIADPTRTPADPVLLHQVHTELKYHRAQLIKYASVLEIETRFTNAEA